MIEGNCLRLLQRNSIVPLSMLQLYRTRFYETKCLVQAWDTVVLLTDFDCSNFLFFWLELKDPNFHSNNIRLLEMELKRAEKTF